MENHEGKDSKAFENELKKAKMIAEKGARFGELAQLPPELESQWLDQITAFDDAFNNAERIKVKKYLGDPVLRVPSELSDEEVSSELNEIIALLHKNNINLDTISEVEEREVYRFIVEELMEEEIDDMRVGGWTTNFIYEEFHPNHEYDIRHYIEDFLNGLFERDREYCDMPLAKELVSYNGLKINSSEAKAKLINFIDSIESAHLVRLEFADNQINEEGAVQNISIEYDLTLQGTGEVVKHQGNGVFSFVYMYGYYYINGIDLPGLRL